MTYYEDLSPYAYFGRYDPPGLKLINVGWLGEGELFPKGETSQEFKAKLFEFCLDKYAVNVTRGFHTCEFCSFSDRQQWSELCNSYGENTYCLGIGNGEIRIIGQSAIYAAPSLIYHYVVLHSYKPPEEFIEAVLFGPAPGSKEHETLLERYRTY
ncbi:hypothetical protein ACE1CI_16545 [Aerosakkonemataceae cyanobacterium BLCC-F50]|uniref:DUF7919 domain-containing protein n=1 Tax=Floridaenema flaviceps BLCC-F50 TaxID=3153642 RepID=A0ABV4XS37_9CYAN